uniref:Proline rich nuclear receptor coactivator 1 n=1 Tax=Erpetoichthys calabaricus TaxID=27687 RepID=A0A8C4RQB8_ERPCA
MYPPSPPSCDFHAAISETLGQHVVSKLVHTFPAPSKHSSHQHLVTNHHHNNNNNSANNNHRRQALMKKPGRKVRPTLTGLQSRHHPNQKHPSLGRGHPSRFSDLNSNDNNAGGSSEVGVSSPVGELAASRNPVAAGAHFHQKGAPKKEVGKSKVGRPDKTYFPSGQTLFTLSKCENPVQSLHIVRQKNIKHGVPVKLYSQVKRNENVYRQESPLNLYHREGKKPLNTADNFKSTNPNKAEVTSEEENLKDGESYYAGAKFSEPPSPSVLPKPPSHWVGDNTQQHSDSCRELMTVHLKTLLKVQPSP